MVRNACRNINIFGSRVRRLGTIAISSNHKSACLTYLSNLYFHNKLTTPFFLASFLLSNQSLYIIPVSYSCKHKNKYSYNYSMHGMFCKIKCQRAYPCGYSDPSDTILEIKKTIAHIKNIMKAGSIRNQTAVSLNGKLHRPIMTPKEVDMPFPPLNLR